MKKNSEIEIALSVIKGIEERAQSTLSKCCQARQVLERFCAPAPKRGKPSIDMGKIFEAVAKRKNFVERNSKTNHRKNP